MLAIGITGGIGSGKSTAVSFFRNYGASVIDADVIARQLIENNKPVYQLIVARFSADILTSEEFIDRKKLRELVFNNPIEKKWLESQLHPLIRQEIKNQLKILQNGTFSSVYVIIDIPLLKARNDFPYLDRILVIDCPEYLQIERVCKRSNLNKETVKNMIMTQISREERNALADDYILNDKDLANLEKSVYELHCQYLKHK